MTVRDIFDFLNAKFPVDTACDFDNPGILIGDPESEVKKAVIALDCTLSAIKTAKKNGCELIITHHPIIFKPLKKVTSDCIAFELIKNGIAVISMHTNLDVVAGGVNDCLCSAIGLENVSKVTASDGYLLNIGEFSTALTDDELAILLKKCLGGSIKYVGCNKKISHVLVCSGSGGSYFEETAKFNCDALITADVKHNVFIDAENLNIAVFDAGHFETEDVAVEPLNKLLSAKFKDICFISDHNSKIKNV